MSRRDLSDARIYSRKRRSWSRLWRIGEFVAVRALCRASALAFLSAAIGYGLVQGGHLDSAPSQDHTIMGRLGPIFGLSAQTIRIAGLKQRPPRAVLSALGIKAGSPLFGFDAENAGKLLENIDWVERASVRFVFPNQLEIDIVERQPFAIWQREGKYYVIDREGVAMGADPGAYAGRLPLVTGNGAQSAVYELFNQLEPHSGLRTKLKAAARVGGRRWTLYFANNVKVALPETNVEDALTWIERASAEHRLLDKGIVSVDLRLPDRAVILPQLSPDGEGESRTLKLSERQ